MAMVTFFILSESKNDISN